MKLIASIEDAKRWGMTHEGSLFGVSAWLSLDGDTVTAAPKFLPLRHWMNFASWAFDVAADLLCNRKTGPLVAPISVGRSIAEIEGRG